MSNNKSTSILLGLTTVCLSFSFQAHAIPMFGRAERDPRNSSANAPAESVEQQRRRMSDADGENRSYQAQETDLLGTAEKLASTWTAQKEEAIAGAAQKNETKNPEEEIRKAHEGKVALLQQGNSIYEDVKGTSDPETKNYLIKIARAYWRAAEEADQIENVWILRKAKNDNKTMLGVSIPGKKHDQLDENLREGLRWAKLTPEERRAELTGEEDSYPEVDRLWREAEDAWSYKAATRWAAENQEAILQKVSAILEEEQQMYDNINLRKTTLGKVSSSFDKATAVLQYVSIANMSPAVVPKAIAIVTDIINRRIQKASLKEASRDFDSQAQLAEELRKELSVAEKIALEKTSIAEKAEHEAVSKNTENLTKLQNIFASELENPLNARRLAAIKECDGIWREGAAAVWKERIKTSAQIGSVLDQEEQSLKPAQDLIKEVQTKASVARNLANEAQQRIIELEHEQTEDSEKLASVKEEIKKLEDLVNGYRADSTTPYETLKAQQVKEREAAGTLYTRIQEREEELSNLRTEASSLEQRAASLEKDYREKYNSYLDQYTLLSRKRERANIRVQVEKQAFKKAWPNELIENEVIEKETSTPDIIEQNSFALENLPQPVEKSSKEEPAQGGIQPIPLSTVKEAFKETPSLKVQDELTKTSGVEFTKPISNDQHLPPSPSESLISKIGDALKSIPAAFNKIEQQVEEFPDHNISPLDEEEEKMKAHLATKTFLRRMAAAQAWQDYNNGFRKEPLTSKSVPIDEDDTEGLALADMEDLYRLKLIQERKDANDRAEEAYLNKRAGIIKVSNDDNSFTEKDDYQKQSLTQLDIENLSHLDKEAEIHAAVEIRAERNEAVGAHEAVKASFCSGKPLPVTPQPSPPPHELPKGNGLKQDHVDAIKKNATIEVARRILDKKNAALEAYKKSKAEEAAKKAAKAATKK